MSSNNNAEFVVPSRQPAARVAGQRRRLSRPPRAPRSNTLPVLTRETGSSSSGDGAACGGSGSGIHSTSSSQTGMLAAASQSMSNLRPPMGVPTPGPIIHDYRENASPAESIVASSIKRPSDPSVLFPIVESSNSKKKSTLALLNPFSHSKTPADPFPPDTPTKAARLLGEISDSDDDENALPKKSWKRKAKQMSATLLYRSPAPTPSRSHADLTDYRASNPKLESNFVYSIGSSSTPATDRKRKGKRKPKAPTVLSKITERSREEDSSDDEEPDLINGYASLAFPPRGDSLGVAVRSPLQAVEDELLDELEEAEIYEAKVVYRRVQPGEIKLVDIPARKKKSGSEGVRVGDGV